MSASMMRSCKLTDLYILTFLAVCMLQANTISALFQYTPQEIIAAINSSCFFGGISPMESEVWQILEELVSVYESDASVKIGYVESNSFIWPTGETLKWNDHAVAYQKVPANERKTMFFRKKKVDRSCLLIPFDRVPTAEMYNGPITVESLVAYINAHCGTFQTTSGKLSLAGMRREDILENVFMVEDISKINMGTLYSTCNNPLNESYTWQHEKYSQRLNERIITKISKKTHQQTCGHYSGECQRDTTVSSPPIATCPRLKYLPSKTEFFYEYLSKSRPVIFENVTSSWTAFKKWSNQFLIERFGHEKVHIKLTPGGDYEGVEKAELWENYDTFHIPSEVHKQLLHSDLVVVRPAGVSMKFSEFMDLINQTAANKLNNISAYLEYSSIPEYMPELEDDIEEPNFVKGVLKRKHLNIWLSDGNTLGRLHFDPFDNLLCQISGKKQVILFEPHDNKKLYEGHIQQATLSYDTRSKSFRRKNLQDSTSMVMSPVDVLNPDFERFPKFADAYPLNCTLTEGDILFLPSFWWHEVQSSPSQTEHRNLAVNFWYEPFLAKEFPCPECKLDVNPEYYHLLH